MYPTPLVSVIIPCYNVAPYIERAVNSILAQSYDNLEICLIDDASTDGTVAKINEFKDTRIRKFLYGKNTKKVGAVNDVLKKITGDYICFQDADDWSEPKRIESQLKEFIKNPDLGICFTNFRYTGKKTYLPGRMAITDKELKEGFLEFKPKKKISFDLPACATMMISRDALAKTGGYHNYFAGRIAEDIHWVYRILKEYEGITVNSILYNYFLRENSLTELLYSGKNAKFAYSFEILEKIIFKDLHEGIDILNPSNKDKLALLELEACEQALIECMGALQQTTLNYKNSAGFKIGKFILTPWRIFKNLKTKVNNRD